MTARPYVLLSVATSLDGYIDDMNEARLMLSNEEDFDRVDEVRAGVDAILVGRTRSAVTTPGCSSAPCSARRSGFSVAWLRTP